MNLVLWILQVVLALIYLLAGGMKVFTLAKVEADFPSMKTLPNALWHAKWSIPKSAASNRSRSAGSVATLCVATFFDVRSCSIA